MSQEVKIAEHPEKPVGQNGEPLFDHRVLILNQKTGAIIAHQPFSTHIWKSGENKRLMYERPEKSGNMFDERGYPIGRWKLDANGIPEKISNEHIATKALPITKMAAAEAEIEALRAENAALKAQADEKPRMKKAT